MGIEQEIYNKLVEQFGIGEICIKKHGKRPSKTWLEFIEAALKLEASELYGFCGFSAETGFGKYFRREFSNIMTLKSNRTWRSLLTSILNLKYCPRCTDIKPYSDFGYESSRIDGSYPICKKCASISSTQYTMDNKEKVSARKKLYNILTKEYKRAYDKNHYLSNKAYYLAKDAKRRATKLQATPKWADLEAIKEVYKNCPAGYHVDHEIPLQGELVCGLHVHKNLKPIPAAENLAKGNKYTIV